MEEMEKLAEELFGDSEERGDFRWMSHKRRDRYERLYDEVPDEGDPMTLEQAERFYDLIDMDVNTWRGDRDYIPHNSMVECMRAFKELWPNVRIRFAGSLEEWGYIDTVYIFYGNVKPLDECERAITLRFKSSLDINKIDNKGICPFCDEFVTQADFERYGVDALYRENTGGDEYLWATPDEFDFYEDPNEGKYVRMWWDD